MAKTAAITVAGTLLSNISNDLSELSENHIPTTLKIGALYKLTKSNINNVDNKKLNHTTNICKDINKPALPVKIEHVNIKTYDHILSGECIVTLLKVQTVFDIYVKLSDKPWSFKNGNGPQLEQSKMAFANACVFQYKDTFYLSEESVFKDCFKLIG